MKPNRRADLAQLSMSPEELVQIASVEGGLKQGISFG